MAIEVTVTGNPSGGLKVIKHIPPTRPCRLEGRNGIGKSALIRLLVLLSGQQPYLDEPASWASLRRLIGATTVSIRGLTGKGSEASVLLTPDLWPERPVETVGEWLGEFTLDGAPKPMAELFTLLEVVHLSGTERLADTLSQQTGRLHRSVSMVSARLGSLDDARADLGEIAERLLQASPAQDAIDRAQRKTAIDNLTEIAGRLSGAQLLANDLTEASTFAALVEGGSVVEHEAKLKGLQVQLEEARSRVGQAEQAQVRALAELSKGTLVQKEIASRERRLQALKRTLTRQLARLTELAPRLEAAGLPSEVESLSHLQLQTLKQATESVETLTQRLRLADASSRRTHDENQLIDDVRGVLDDATRSGLSDTVVARVNDFDITVETLGAGLGYLPATGSDLESLTTANRELAELREIAELFAKREITSRDHDELLEEMRHFDPDAADHDELRKNAADARTELDDATAVVRAINMRIGALSRGALGDDGQVIDFAARLTEILDEHRVAPDQLLPTLTTALMTVATLENQARETKARIDDLSRSEQRRRRMRSSLKRESITDHRKFWLSELADKLASAPESTSRRDKAPDQSHDSSGDSWTDDEWPDSTWQGLADHVSHVKGTLDRLVAAVTGLEVTTARPVSMLATTPMDSAVKVVVEEEALRELSAQPIVDALFDGGILTRVSLDEGESTITWQTPEGESRTRPMSAFSSGQQALGFMRARLQQVADDAHENRLVFLDEFGAFVSAEQRRPLADLLTSSELQALTDQVIVVLPLQADYGRELDETTGELHLQYERRARAVQTQGYFTEEFQG